MKNGEKADKKKLAVPSKGITGRVTAATTPVLRAVEMMALFNVSRSTLYRRVLEEEGFPKPKPMGPSSRRWIRDEVTKYLSEKMGFDASQLVSDCLTAVREQTREQIKRVKKTPA